MIKVDNSGKNPEIWLKKDLLESVKFIEKTFAWLENSRLNSVPDTSLTEIEKPPVVPTHLIFTYYKFSLFNRKEQVNRHTFLENLANLYRENQSFFSGVYLVGQKWLDFDGDDMLKGEGIARIIAVDRTPLKVIDKNQILEVQNSLEKNNVWIWHLKSN